MSNPKLMALAERSLDFIVSELKQADLDRADQFYLQVVLGNYMQFISASLLTTEKTIDDFQRIQVNHILEVCEERRQEIRENEE